MPDQDFESRLGRRLRDYSEHGRRPFDAVEIARAARVRAGAGQGGRPRNPLTTIGRWVLVGALLATGLVAVAFAGGLLPPDTAVIPTPTPMTTGSPGPAVTPSAELTPLPTGLPSPSLSPSTTERPTTAPSTPTPAPTGTVTPSASPSATPTAPALGAWREIADFPFGDATHLTSITAGGPGYVAVGWASDGAGGTIGARAWTSVDGQSWTAASSPSFAGARLRHVVRLCDGNLFALGPIPNDDPDFPELGQDRVWRSTDGADWELLPQPPEFAGAVVEDAIAAGCILYAGGHRQGEGRVDAAVWTSLDGIEWHAATQPPDLHDVTLLAPISPGGGTVVAVGNARGESAPFRTFWHSIELDEPWVPAAASGLDDPLVNVVDVAGQLDGFIAVGWRGNLADTRAFSIGSGDGTEWTDISATEFVMQVMNRVIAVSGGFVALGAAVEVQTQPCAPADCVSVEPIEPRAWRHTFGGGWQPIADPPFFVDEYSAIAVGANGVVVSNYSFDGGVWLAPLGEE